jgi:arginase family enzyme
MREVMKRQALHVTWPRLLQLERADGSLSLHNAAHGTSIDVEEGSRELVSEILTAFREPRTVDDFAAASDEDTEQLLTFLVRSCFVVEVDELPFLEHGFFRPTTAPVGALLSWSDLPDVASRGAWVVLGAPVDSHALGRGGAREGPSEIRKAINGPLLTAEGDVVDYEFGRLYRGLRPSIADLGDVDPEGSRMDHVGQRLVKVVRELLQRGMRPLLLGGDQSITHYALAALTSEVPRFGVIHFDAHHDLLPSASLSHANALRAAVDSERVESLVQIGLRMVERMSPYAVRVPCPKRQVVTAREARAGGALAVLEALPKDVPYYLSFDIDCIDAALARETGTPAYGGLSFELALDLVDYIARNFDLIGADFVEVAGREGPVHGAAAMAASLLQRCVLGPTEFEPLSSDVYLFD